MCRYVLCSSFILLNRNPVIYIFITINHVLIYNLQYLSKRGSQIYFLKNIRVTPGFTKNIVYLLYIIPFLFHYRRFCIVIGVVVALIPLYVHNRISMINSGLETVRPLGSYQLLITYLLTKTLYQIFTRIYIRYYFFRMKPTRIDNLG